MMIRKREYILTKAQIEKLGGKDVMEALNRALRDKS